MRLPPDIGLRATAIAVAAACLLPFPLRAESPVLARAGDAPITRAEVEQLLRIPLYELEVEKYRLTRRRLDQMIVERLLARAAAAQGQSVSAFVSAAVQSRIAAIPPEADPAKQDERNALVRERATQAVQDLVARLSREAGVTVALHPPDAPVMTVPVGDDPAWGPPTAPVTVIEFADFECPACKESLPVLRQVRDFYKDRVRFIYRDFPLASHPQARPAAEAAQCAHEQGQFWAYHDELFAQAPNLKTSDYMTLAERLGLNQAEFASCLAGARPKAAVARDLADAQGLGLSGTPTFFVNGRYLSGFQTLEAFRQHIDRELLAARDGARAPASATGTVSR